MQIIKGARGRITGHFGDTDVPGANVKKHGGTDIGHGSMTADDLRVVAPASGTISFAGRLGTYGNCLQIDHGDGWVSLLAHLSDFAQTAGEVSQGEHIATMGDTGGDWPVHLHQELRRHGIQLDPELYFGSAPAGGGITPIRNGAPDMRLFASTSSNKWYLVGPGIFQPIAKITQGPYIEAYGDRIAVTDEQLAQISADMLSGRDHDFAVIANVETDQWALTGPGYWYPIPPGEGALWEARFGTRQAVSADEFSALYRAFEQ